MNNKYYDSLKKEFDNHLNELEEGIVLNINVPFKTFQDSVQQYVLNTFYNFIMKDVGDGKVYVKLISICD